MTSRLIAGFIVMATALLLVTACDRKPVIHEDSLNVLGTFAQINIVGMEPEAASAAARKAEENLQALDAIGFTFEQEGELHRLNEAFASGKTIEVGDDLLELLQHASRLAATSQGLFNPAAGELTALWEFQCEQEDCQETRYSDEVRQLVGDKIKNILEQQPSMQDIVIKGNRVHSRNPAVKLEFGDIIRGLALDKSMAHLKHAGVKNAMIDIGGSVHTTGTRGEHAWWIGIPDASGEHHIGYIETNKDESVFTARALDRSFGKQGVVYRHVVDPRNGLPVEHIKSITVVHKSAMIANAAATAFMVADIKNWKSLADSMGVHALLLTTSDGVIYTTPAIDHRVHWKQGVTHRHLVP